VDKGGNISDVKALTSHGYGMEEEAVRAIKRGPKWTPAIQNGRNVNAYRQQPITFVVADQ
jgi:periplasmic protein TonB